MPRGSKKGARGGSKAAAAAGSRAVDTVNAPPLGQEGYQQAQQQGMIQIDPRISGEGVGDGVGEAALAEAGASIQRLAEAHQLLALRDANVGGAPAEVSAEDAQALSNGNSLLSGVAPQANMGVAQPDAPKVKRGRGRPPKNRNPDLAAASNGVASSTQVLDPAIVEATAMQATAEGALKRKRDHLPTTADDVEGAESLKRLKEAPGREAPVLPIPDEDFDPAEQPDAGPFTKYEMERIHNFALRYRQQENLTEQGIISLVQDQNRKQDKVVSNFWKGLHNELPRRTITAIRKRCRRVFHNYDKRGSWSAEEDEMLREAYTATPDRWVTIGNVLGRMPEDCRDRWRNYLACGDKRRSKEWTQKEEVDLTNAVNECIAAIKSDKRREAREKGNAFREDHIDWVALVNFNHVSAKLDHTRSRLQCYQHWHTMQKREVKREQKRLDAEDDTEGAAQRNAAKQDKHRRWRSEEAGRRWAKMEAGDKYAILKQIAESGSYEEKKVPWPKIKREHPDQPWTTADRKDAFQRMKLLLPDNQRDLPLEVIVRKLMEYFQRNHGDELDTFFQGTLEPFPRAGRKRKSGAEGDADGDASGDGDDDDDEDEDDDAEHDGERDGEAVTEAQTQASPQRKRKSKQGKQVEASEGDDPHRSMIAQLGSALQNMAQQMVMGAPQANMARSTAAAALSAGNVPIDPALEPANANAHAREGDEGLLGTSTNASASASGKGRRGRRAAEE